MMITLQIQISLAVVAILLLRQAMKKMPKIYSYLLWLLIFVRLLVPISFESRFSFMPSEQEREMMAEQMLDLVGITDLESDAIQVLPVEGALPENGGAYGNLAEETVGSGKIEDSTAGAEISDSGLSSTIQGTADDDLKADFIEILGIKSLPGAIFLALWAVGAAVVLGVNARALARTRKLLGKQEVSQRVTIVNPFTGKEKSIPVYYCKNSNTPFTLGLFQPAIYLPAGLTDEEQEYILCHERVHISRKDNLVKHVAFLLTAIYWFNPFVWVAFFLMERDMEMSCDEKVLELMGGSIKRNYSQSLLNFAKGSGKMPTTHLTFGENSVKQRVKNVLSYKNAKKWSLGLGAVVLVVVVVALFTTGQNESEQDASNRLTQGQENQGEQDSSGQGVVDSSGNVVDNQEPQDDIKPDVQQEIYEEVTNRNAEYYMQYLGYSLEFTAQGIYRNQDGERTNIYPYYIGPDLVWCVADNILYFTTDSSYQEGDEEYVEDVVCMLDLATGEFDKETLRLENIQASQQKIWDMFVSGGFVLFNCGEARLTSKVYAMPLINTGNTALATGYTYSGEAVKDLTAEEQDAYSVDLRNLILKKDYVVKLANRTMEETFAYVDLDGDGKAEKIVLSADKMAEGYEHATREYDYFNLQVGDSVIAGYRELLENEIWAFSPDGENIVLALCGYETPWDVTQLYIYRNGELHSAGKLSCHIEDVLLIRAEGILRAEDPYHNFMQPVYVRRDWALNESGQMEKVPQDTYDIVMGRTTLPDLLVPLPVHETPGGEEVTYMQPQKVSFLQFNSTFDWVYIWAADGSSGWFQIEVVPKEHGISVLIPELGVKHGEVFTLYYAG